MDVDGCGWVRWDVGAIGRCKNKTSRHKNGCTGHNLIPMAGEISPNIMFGESWREGTKMVADACKWVGMSDYGCIGNGRTKNKTKKVLNG